MCGIAGWYRRGGRPVDAARIDAQCDVILHRGPDDSGVLTDGDFGFGMRRLSILDIPGGHQPMTSPDGRFSIVFNGEIFNHLDVREPLISAGYPFTSHSDTETILAAFAQWGNDAWAKLEGMFAVAIWDRQTRELTLARDQLGIKPLYISEQRGGLSFASELKALRTLPDHDFAIEDRAVHDFFSFGHVRRPRSIYSQVGTLEPGHYLTIGPEGAARTQAYWRPRLQPASRMSIDGWAEQMRSMLLETTARHLQSDVPVGVFLSGGLDSSAIAAAMARSSGQPFKAFTIGYPGTKMDETSAAREIARHLGFEHIVEPLDVEAARQALPEIQRCYDEPFAARAAIPTWYVSKLAAQHVKVVLDGAGGDELFGGYKRHRNARAVERLRPWADRIPLASAINRLPITGTPALNYLRQHAQRLSELLDVPDGAQQFFAANQISRRSERRRVYSADFWARHEGGEPFARLEQEYFPDGLPRTASALEQFMFADLTINLPSMVLPRLDRASMAHSLEARVPLVSHKMVEWALTVPIDMKLRGNVSKYILRRAIDPWLPPSVAKRPKQGFQIPLISWMRGKLGDRAREVWHASGAASAGYLDASAVDRMFAEHKRGHANHGRILYAIGIFGSWYMDHGQVRPPA